MATGTLTSTTIAARYKSLLKITGTANDVFHATTLKIIEDGDGNNSCIQLAQNRVEIVPVANHANAFEVSQADGTQIFNIASDTPALTINAATVTLTQDTNFVTSGDVNGMSIDGTTFSVDGSNNRIGIGLADPGYPLEVYGASSTTYAIGTLTTGVVSRIRNGDGTNNNFASLLFSGETTNTEITHIEITNNNSALAFQLEGDSDVEEAMRIVGQTGATLLGREKPGFVGIGTPNPIRQLHIQDITASSSGAGGGIRLSSSDGAAIADGHRLGFIEFTAAEGAETSTGLRNSDQVIGASIQALASETWDTSNNGTNLYFSTTEGNDDLAIKMTILASGYVGIGTTTPADILNIKLPATTGDAPLTLLRLDVADEGVDIDAEQGPAIDFRVAEEGSTGGISAYNSGKIAVVRENSGDTNAAAAMTFWTGADGANATEKMRILSTGKVGIGEATPDEILHLTSSVSLKPILLIQNTHTDANSPSIKFLKNEGAAATDGDVIGEVKFFSSDGSNNTAEEFAKLSSWVSEKTATTEDGAIELAALAAGTIRSYVRATGNGIVTNQAEVVINDDSIDMDFRVESNSTTKCLLVEGSSGFVGVNMGATALTSTLNVKQTAGDLGLRLYSSGGTIIAGLEGDGNEDGQLYLNDNVGTTQTYFTGQATASSYLKSPTAKFGIGRSDPQNQLEIAMAAADSTLELSCWSTTETESGTIMFRKSGIATVGTLTNGVTVAEETLGRIEAYGVDDNDNLKLSSHIEFVNDINSDGDASPGRIEFGTSDSSANNSVVRMTIDDSGNIYMPAYANGDMSFTSSSGLIATSSDIRVKKDIETLELDGLAKVNALNPVTYKWREKSLIDGEDVPMYDPEAPNDGIEMGFIAQEVAEIIPQASPDYGDDSQRGIFARPIIAMLVKAVQELSAKVEALENNNQQGESSNEQEQEQSADSGNSGGDVSSESSGQDSGGADADSSDSSSSVSGSSEASDSSSDDGNESSGSSGSNSSDDSEGGSGEDDSGGEGQPSEEWTKDELKDYMIDNAIAFNSGDTKQDLLDKISLAGEGPNED